MLRGQYFAVPRSVCGGTAAVHVDHNKWSVRRSACGPVHERGPILNNLPVDKRIEGTSVLENESRRLEYHAPSQILRGHVPDGSPGKDSRHDALACRKAHSGARVRVSFHLVKDTLRQPSR